MPTQQAKELLRELRGTPIKVPGRGYKEAYSNTVWTLVEQLLEDHERLEKHAENLENTLKGVINHSQLAMSEMRRLTKGLVETASKVKSLPHIKEAEEETNGDSAEDTDLKGR